MGLDMYLRADEYVSGWDHGAAEDQERFRTVLGALGKKPEDITPDSPSLTVSYMVGYWRKANAIHNWFVTNVQNGVDECQKAHVDREQLEDLRDLAQAALTFYEQGHLDKVAKVLPPTSGFFFGSTDVDEWFAADLRSTVEQLTKVLTNDRLQDCEFYYESSW